MKRLIFLILFKFIVMLMYKTTAAQNDAVSGLPMVKELKLCDNDACWSRPAQH
jgi:hypothetical protein